MLLYSHDKGAAVPRNKLAHNFPPYHCRLACYNEQADIFFVEKQTIHLHFKMCSLLFIYSLLFNENFDGKVVGFNCLSEIIRLGDALDISCNSLFFIFLLFGTV